MRIKTELADYSRAHPDARVAPFAVNQIVHASNDRLEHDVAVCVKHRCRSSSPVLRAPQEVVKLHAYGGIVFHDVINVRHARKGAEAGVDGLILVCAGAGGHAGTLSPFALVAEVRSWFKGTIVLSGAIANGSAVLAAQAMGADLAYVGTRFIATREANASREYKQMLIDSSAGDIVYSSLFSGVLGNYLKPSVAAAGYDPDNLPSDDKSKMNFSSSSKAWRDVWSAGQGVGSITDIPSVADCVARLREEYAAAAHDLARTAHWPGVAAS